MMHSFSKYYKLNQLLLSCVGLWPYQSERVRKLLTSFGYSTLGISLFTQMVKLIETDFDFDFCLRSLAYIVPTIAYCIEYFFFHSNLDNMKILLEMIEHDWDALHGEAEVEILRKSGELGKQITLACTIFIYGGFCGFVVTLFAPKFLDVITPGNEPHLLEFPAKAEYFVDEQKYFYWILVHMVVIVVTGLTVILAISMIFLVFWQHSCAMFKIASYRIQTAVGDSALCIPAEREEQTLLANLVRAVMIHKRGTEIADRLLDTFSLCYMLLLVAFLISASMNLYRLIQAITLMSDLEELFNSFLFVFGHYQIMFLFNYAMHVLSDRSSDIYESTYSGYWYETSPHVQKLILMMLLRSVKIYRPVVGRIFYPSLEGFAQIASTSFSYFTVVYSMR